MFLHTPRRYESTNWRRVANLCPSHSPPGEKPRWGPEPVWTLFGERETLPLRSRTLYSPFRILVTLPTELLRLPSNCVPGNERCEDVYFENPVKRSISLSPSANVELFNVTRGGIFDCRTYTSVTHGTK